ncbi:alpha-glucosidase [Mariniphaga anaerophila]|uniref:Alpha-glucosidase n=1 Tax=Mariniphaga anaerophila TaxID=1484053 RepID=A0A1M5FKQ1_9BACT|nr:glycoside hydrolase family 97 protein [Mariniphaga anaerophila]SHF92187.1 alpha-glucosidase [Mariniphaga anaerophila]
MKRIVIIICVNLLPYIGWADTIKLFSPDKKTKVEIHCNKEIYYSIYHLDREILDNSKIGLVGFRESLNGDSLDFLTRKNDINEQIDSPFYRFASYKVSYNELQLTFKQNYLLQFRVYNGGGVAYRFVLNRNRNAIVKNEIAEFNFDNDYKVYAAHTTGKNDPFATSFQNTYQVSEISRMDTSLIFLPVVVDIEDEWKVTITESDLEDYPGMFLKLTESKKGFNGVYAPYPAKVDCYPWRKQEYVTKREPYIAKVNKKQRLPWRIITISEKDTEMPVNNMVYALASPNRIGDYSWAKPGKSAWEWWNDWGIHSVDFMAGINMDTYKYYIDFASKYGLEYVILDEGWYDGKKGNLFQVIPELDLQELVSYAKDRNIGVILWAVFNVLDSQLDEACKYYSEMGIKGFKVDFLDRDDQEAVKMVYRIAETTAKYKLILDLHGIYKPTGLNRTYPHIMNFEGVFGLEEMKWSTPEVNMPEYNVTFPFIRLMAGPVDYTPGAMRNASKKDFQPIYSNPLSQGTRCHQLATYVVFDSPLTMLCDAPTYYEKEQEFTNFLASIPVIPDETKILQGQLGEFIVTAKRFDTDWYIGGLSNWNERELNLDLSFLENDVEYQAVIYNDGINSNKQASDYVVERREVNANTKLKLHCASGGGVVIKLSQK